ncbi:hypothetical protein BOTBODRAFT_184820 [Botryobasidium botryosum FD-172 SS1]|uniref:Stealth protein CR3 conserved region 3 domain-containing protein n=1 Tax=Botryobasidium botryosum (strain FD-172 SS1) TaxID=930990 RepID=A0A067N4G1_BOTB1|nr:hypothetical protein BOTBODRAFT_184820 [Botryobasidium botryosum FD-172 SS1]
MRQHQPDYLPLTQDGITVDLNPRPREIWTISRRRSMLWTGVGLCLTTFLLIAYFHDPVIMEVADVLWFSPNSYYGYHGSYLPFALPTPASSLSQPLLPVQALPTACIEDHFVNGGPCFNNRTQMDVLWTWVNGSDPFLQGEKEATEKKLSPDDPYRPIRKNQARQYRDHDELRHSMRSVLTNFRSSASRFHLLTSDFKLTSEVKEDMDVDDADPPWRLGQMPQWLNMEQIGRWQDDAIPLQIHHHAQIFREYQGTTFNSYAIESQMGNLRDITENFVYMNDDFYMLRPLTPMSFYTSAYGMVLQMQPSLIVSPFKAPPNMVLGEWKNLQHSNWLLGNRFGSRHRPYTAHEAKAASLPMLQEISQIWRDEITRTSHRPFRETVGGDGHFHMFFVQSHYIVERWREALLWSFIVGKIGGLDDSWGAREASLAWEEIGGTPGEAAVVVQPTPRSTLDFERVDATIRDSGFSEERRTRYVFSSQDGYPYSELGTTGQRAWPTFSSDGTAGGGLSCKIDFTECFGSQGGLVTRASQVFMNIAFAKPTQCGDCLIKALVVASGSTGLSAFLPDKSRTFSSPWSPFSGHPDLPPHLPLVDNWQKGDFSLTGILGSQDVNIRDWTMQLLHRYRFVIADIPSMFTFLTDPGAAQGELRKIDRSSVTALLCINDDVKWGDERVAQLMKDWQRRRWPQPASWERVDSS